MSSERLTIEDPLATFEAFVLFQGLDIGQLAGEQLDEWREIYEEARTSAAHVSPRGPLSVRPVPGQFAYAIATRDGDDLFVALWLRRNRKGELFVMRPLPRGIDPLSDGTAWDPHVSYHLDGTIHSKSYDRRYFRRKEQPPTGAFRGCVGLGMFAGFSPRSTGAVCDPSSFHGVVEVPRGVLMPLAGAVSIDLIEPGFDLSTLLELPHNRIVSHCV